MNCLVCLGEAGALGHHPRCLRRLFRTPVAPSIDLDLARFQTVALGMIGRASISGIQRKISVGLRVWRETLQLDTTGHRYILKPPSDIYPALPANEHVSMRLAELFGIATPPNGLVRMTDSNLAYVVARFDRPHGAPKRRQEDFCQLAFKSPKEKYQGSAEECARIIRRYAAEPAVDLLRLFERLVFDWWIGNGDAHLKNFSLLEDAEGRFALSPAYDLMNSWIVLPRRDLALPIGGKHGKLTRRNWLEFAAYCGLPRAIAERTLARPAGRLAASVELVRASYLPDDLKEAYVRTLEEQAAML